jgi:hypothetical protein
MQMTQLIGHCPPQYEADEEALPNPNSTKLSSQRPSFRAARFSALFSSKSMSACLARTEPWLPSHNRSGHCTDSTFRHTPSEFVYLQIS